MTQELQLTEIDSPFFIELKDAAALAIRDLHNYDRLLVAEDGRTLLKVTPEGDVLVGDDGIDIKKLFVMDDSQTRQKAIEDLRRSLQMLLEV